MKQNLRNPNYADISVMTASRKQVTPLLRIDVFQSTEILLYALVICGV